ncbi:hypothetical protein DNH61_24450 [Paenibacillus sambharensis]|uniref:DUF2252 domain-containing protein n=1 Tax=Paenibacillus sambharensis TaxID=1803190 RepID=A0A2W1L2Y1_9BACL|nr:DUF2252 family protein [Paenibacillus sambharensis]PZD93199.1 hypothetical protein DNH61_24450 [Paenibacillus sambharensis]
MQNRNKLRSMGVQAPKGAARKSYLASKIRQANAFYNDRETKDLKFKKLGASSFSFFRGTPDIFFYDLAKYIIVPEEWKGQPGLTTWVQGDAHIQNVGFYHNSKGECVFDLNDLDSAFIGPFYWDLLRFLTSLFLERDNSGQLADLLDEELKQSALVFLDAYRSTLADVSSASIPSTAELTKERLKGFTRRVMKELAKGSHASLLDKWTKVKDGERVLRRRKTKYRALSEEERQRFETAWHSYPASLAEFAEDRLSVSSNYWRIKDVAYRINQGTASLGTTRYHVLLEGSPDGPDGDILLDVKQQLSPPMLAADQALRERYVELFGQRHGERARAAHDALTGDKDIYAGVLTLDNVEYAVRSISPFKGDYTDVGGFGGQKDLDNYLSHAGQAYALAHARSDNSFHAGYVPHSFEDAFAAAMDDEAWSRFCDELLELSFQYYEQVKSDYQLLAGDLLSGTLLGTHA